MDVQGKMEKVGRIPENFDSDVEKMQNGKLVGKFISSQVLEHPNEEEQRKMNV